MVLAAPAVVLVEVPLPNQMLSLAQLLPQVEAEAVRQGVDPVLAQSILIAENMGQQYDPNKMVSAGTVSPKGATGVMQVMPATLRALIAQGYADANTDLSTVDGGIHAGVAALKELGSRLGTNDPKILAVGYNGSPQVVKAYVSGNPQFAQQYPETAQYVQRIDMARDSIGTGAPGAKPNAFTAPMMGLAARMQQYQSAGDTVLASLKAAVGMQEKSGEEAKAALEAKKEGQLNQAGAAYQTGTHQIDVLAKLRKSTGLEVEDPNSAYSMQMARMDKAQAEVDALTPQIAKAQSADMLTNPLGWLLGQSKMVTLAPRYQNAVATVQNARSAIEARQAIAHNQTTLEAQTTAEALALQTSGQAAIAAADATLGKVKIDQDTLALRTRVMTEELAVSGNLFQADATMYRLLQEKLGQKKMDEASKDEQEILDRVNTGLGYMGIPPIRSLTEYKLLANNPQTREVLSGIGFTGKAGSPGKTMVAVEQLNALPNIKQQDPVRGAFIETFHNYVANELQRGRPDPKVPGMFKEYTGTDTDKIQAAADNVANRWTTDAATTKNMRMLQADNPYRMRSKVYAAAPELKGNIIAAYAQGEKNEVDEEKLLAYASAQIMAHPQQLDAITRQFHDYMQYGQQHQFKSFGMNSSGWDTKGANKYLITTDWVSRSLFSNGREYEFDLLNEPKLKRWLQQQAIVQLKDSLKLQTPMIMTPMGDFTGFQQ